MANPHANDNKISLRVLMKKIVAAGNEATVIGVVPATPHQRRILKESP